MGRDAVRPLALIVLTWIAFQRSGMAEASRFARAAAEMRREAQALDRIVTALSVRLKENRAALGEQSERMLQQGDAAAERLAAISNGVAHETASIDAHAQRLLQAATAARADMSVLLATLPKALARRAAWRRVSRKRDRRRKKPRRRWKRRSPR